MDSGKLSFDCTQSRSGIEKLVNRNRKLFSEIICSWTQKHFMKSLRSLFSGENKIEKKYTKVWPLKILVRLKRKD
jgi:hypothetical protein